MQRRKQADKVIHNSIDDMRDHAAGMKDDVRDIGEAVKDILIEKLSDMLKRTVSFGQTKKDAAEDAVLNMRDQLEVKIQAQPYKAMLVAAGVGLMLGLILRRR